MPFCRLDDIVNLRNRHVRHQVKSRDSCVGQLLFEKMANFQNVEHGVTSINDSVIVLDFEYRTDEAASRWFMGILANDVMSLVSGGKVGFEMLKHL